ncbi:hypothetical protein [Bacillus sp. JNUCC-22]|uniref:hypothetical protein n=1 Tax=Bacillus sp. JNUCC-22 TaxID=2842457 RepID=UPI0020915120|nr:hypothetical protein [Bacillus sp. JNUCC-22]
MTDKKQTSMFSFFLFIMAAWIIVLFFTVIAALPSSAIQLTKHQSKTVSMIYPQSWGFFSKDPREDSLNIYLLDADMDDEESALDKCVRACQKLNRARHAADIAV